MVVTMAPDKPSIFHEGSDWTTVSPLVAVQSWIQLASSDFLTKIHVSGVKLGLGRPSLAASRLQRSSSGGRWPVLGSEWGDDYDNETPGSQVDSPVAKENRKEGGGRKMRDLHMDT